MRCGNSRRGGGPWLDDRRVIAGGPIVAARVVLPGADVFLTPGARPCRQVIAGSGRLPQERRSDGRPGAETAVLHGFSRPKRAKGSSPPLNLPTFQDVENGARASAGICRRQARVPAPRFSSTSRPVKPQARNAGKHPGGNGGCPRRGACRAGTHAGMPGEPPSGPMRLAAIDFQNPNPHPPHGMLDVTKKAIIPDLVSPDIRRSLRGRAEAERQLRCPSGRNAAARSSNRPPKPVRRASLMRRAACSILRRPMFPAPPAGGGFSRRRFPGEGDWT